MVFAFNLSYRSFADEAQQKTDDSFSGWNSPKTVKSSFMGDDSNSVDNNSLSQPISLSSAIKNDYIKP